MTDTTLPDLALDGMPLSMHQLPPAIIEPLREACVLPVAAENGLANGVFRADGTFCNLSRTRISDSRFTDIPAAPSKTPEKRIAGNYLFGGLGRHHFGHFVLETLSRIWALDGRQHQFDGLILLPMPKTDFSAVLRRRMLSVFQLMGVDMPLHLVRTPITVERLHLPSQGIGHMEWAVGTEDFRRYVRDRIDRNCPAIGPGKIYISRGRLKHANQRIDQEARIEKLMKSAGYTIFHPQRHSIRAQCQIYRAAHTIVGGDGSAFHLAPFALQPETRVGLIQRRLRAEPADAIANQIKAFTTVDLVRINALKDVEEDSLDENAPDPVKFRRLKNQLEAACLI
jgi:capsular polysaccharide biosynthesis protein